MDSFSKQQAPVLLTQEPLQPTKLTKSLTRINKSDTSLSSNTMLPGYATRRCQFARLFFGPSSGSRGDCSSRVRASCSEFSEIARSDDAFDTSGFERSSAL